MQNIYVNLNPGRYSLLPIGESWLYAGFFLVFPNLLGLWVTIPSAHHKGHKLLLVIYTTFYCQLVWKFGFRKTLSVLGWPCKNGDFISNDFIFYLFGTMTVNINQNFSFQHVGESVLISPFSISHSITNRALYTNFYYYFSLILPMVQIECSVLHS